jgi:poly(ADP-ribose) glycohydrolase ARH3
MAPTLTSKFVGAILCSALGDAVGQLAFTHTSRDALRRHIDRSELLRYTDDTAMTIGLAESIIQNGTIAEQHLGDTFARNFEREPWRGYAAGPPTIFAMVRRERIRYRDAAGRIFDGAGSFGNGAAM